MDSSWAQYNMARLRMGMDAFIKSADINDATELHDKQLYERMRPHLVKIYARSRAGQPAGEFSGFLYSSSSEAIVSAAHIVGFTGNPPGSGPHAEVFKARYSDGFEEDIDVLISAANNVPDVAIMRGSRCAPRSLVSTLCSIGDTVYALGFSPQFDTPSFSKGIVSCGKAGSVATTAYGDIGYSGGPVVNLRGHLVGIIRGGIGTTIKQVGLTPAGDVQTFLQQAGLPLLA